MSMIDASITQSIYWAIFGPRKGESWIMDCAAGGVCVTRTYTGVWVKVIKFRGGHDYDPGWQEFLHYENLGNYPRLSQIAALVDRRLMLWYDEQTYQVKIYNNHP